MDLVIDTPDESVDMKSGLSTMSGVSDSVRYISETILAQKVPRKITSKKSVRTTLKKSFKGSYGHVFSVDIYDADLEKRLRNIGQQAFVEMIAYFYAEALYLESKELSPKAKKIIDDLGEEGDELITQLRKSSLRHLHEIPKKFQQSVKVRYRKNRNEQRIVGIFNTATSESVEAKKTNEDFWIRAAISRFNINTGNGRLVVEEEEHTVAFGFMSKYKDLKVRAKKVISKNLDYNNGLENEHWKYLNLRVTPIRLRDRTVVKYLLKGYESDE